MSAVGWASVWLLGLAAVASATLAPPRATPQPVAFVPSDSAALRELGRRLFYDSRLSAQGHIACASCHQQRYAFSGGPAGLRVAPGVSLRRKSPSLVNIGDNAAYTWADPTIRSLVSQARIPLFGSHPKEMAVRPAFIARLLRCDGKYSELVSRAFPRAPDPYRPEIALSALAAFERTIVSANSPFDRFRSGDRGAISAEARRGAALFFGERVGCVHCHAAPNFTDNVKRLAGGPFQQRYHNTGLYNVRGRSEYPSSDRGLFEVTRDPNDEGAFRTPSLRNVQLAAPYFHDGSSATLREVIRGYERGGRRIVTVSGAQDGSQNLFKSVLIQPFTLSHAEEDALIAFLTSLTDDTVVRDRRFANPFPRPPRPFASGACRNRRL